MQPMMKSDRNTSACAEKTGCVLHVYSTFEKHLRLRGENDAPLRPPHLREETPPLARRKRTCQYFFLFSAETPPLARRKRISSGTRSIRARNTSACAEKTRFHEGLSGLREKHLRLRGENRMREKLEELRTETPPLARRKRTGNLLVHNPVRNTSACAEKTQKYP